jgi:hypothetical protein
VLLHTEDKDFRGNALGRPSDARLHQDRPGDQRHTRRGANIIKHVVFISILFQTDASHKPTPLFAFWISWRTRRVKSRKSTTRRRLRGSGGGGSSGGGGERAAEEEGGGGGKRSKFEGVVDHCSPARAIHINDMITQFVAGFALPFFIVSSVFFIAMVVS